MWESIWQILNVVTVGSLLWLGIMFLLAVLGELGLPVTGPILEGTLIFAGFQIAHGVYIGSLLPFLILVPVGRLCGSASAYRLSSSLGSTIIDKYGKYVRITKDRLERAKQKLGSFTLPAIIAARFTPGFTILSSLASGISKIGFKRFMGAVTIQLLIWEGVLLILGGLGGEVSRYFEPQFYPIFLGVWIAVMIAVGVAVKYFASRRASH
jgi:membrane protein DedA with SNARE-associated domain